MNGHSLKQASPTVDVVQSIRPSLGAPTSRGVAVVGLTSRIVCLSHPFPLSSTFKRRTDPPPAQIQQDTLHLLEKRVKSRFSHRIIRVNSPLNGDRSHLALARESLPAGMSRIRFNGAIEEADEDEEEEEEPELGWVGLVGRALVPWERGDEIGEEGEWRRSWRESIEVSSELIDHIPGKTQLMPFFRRFSPTLPFGVE